MATDADKTDTSNITQWRSIVTLVVFVATNVNVLFPFHIPFYVPRRLSNAVLDTLSAVRVLRPRRGRLDDDRKQFVRLNFPMNFVTAPLIADLFLLAISAIGRDEVAGGTLGTDHISPIDIMVFFITLAYIAISIDASGIIRWLAYWVLRKAGNSGRKLFFYLYIFFALLGSFIGNDPIILSGTPFLAYMTHISSNIKHPRAWIFTQFSVANVVSAILVSSNPTNLVLAGAFEIRFIDYTANMIVPVIITVLVLFPLLLFVIFGKEELVPRSVTLHELPEEIRAEKPKNPCIPYAKGAVEEEENLHADDDRGKILELAEIMHPYLDLKSAIFGAFVLGSTLIIVLVLNATKPDGQELQVFWVTLPAAVVMFCWDITSGWLRRAETREIAHNGRRELERARAERAEAAATPRVNGLARPPPKEPRGEEETLAEKEKETTDPTDRSRLSPSATDTTRLAFAEREDWASVNTTKPTTGLSGDTLGGREKDADSEMQPHTPAHERTSLESLVSRAWAWSRETFPTATAVLSQLPVALVPFAFTMFVLVQALVTKGWVPVFAYGWDHWVRRTGTIGAIGGMGFVSVVLCNFAGTNIGTTILICRVLQSWQAISEKSGEPISNRTFWATVYSMALGVNYGAFSTAFSASLAGLLWRDILGRKHIHVRARDFARFNIPIIAAAMTVGCVVLIGEVYITRDTTPYVSTS